MGVILNEQGQIIRSFTGKNRDSDTDVWLFQTQLAESEDSGEAQQYQHSGFASRPPDGSKIIVSDLGGGNFNVSIAEDDGVLNDDMAVGESRMYSIVSGAAKAIIKALVDGSINITAPNKVIVDTDVIAQLVSLFEHKHIDSWGKPTTAPLPQGAPTPPPPTTVILDSNIDTATNSKTIDGKQFLSHTHPIIGGSSAPGPTGGVS